MACSQKGYVRNLIHASMFRLARELCVEDMCRTVKIGRGSSCNIGCYVYTEWPKKNGILKLFYYFYKNKAK